MNETGQRRSRPARVFLAITLLLVVVNGFFPSVWLFLTSLVILLGAEINAEMEHQTAKDTTVGPEKPMGERNAYVADNMPNE